MRSVTNEKPNWMSDTSSEDSASQKKEKKKPTLCDLSKLITEGTDKNYFDDVDLEEKQARDLFEETSTSSALLDKVLELVSSGPYSKARAQVVSSKLGDFKVPVTVKQLETLMAFC